MLIQWFDSQIAPGWREAKTWQKWQCMALRVAQLHCWHTWAHCFVSAACLEFFLWKNYLAWCQPEPYMESKLSEPMVNEPVYWYWFHVEVGCGGHCLQLSHTTIVNHTRLDLWPLHFSPVFVPFGSQFHLVCHSAANAQAELERLQPNNVTVKLDFFI